MIRASNFVYLNSKYITADQQTSCYIAETEISSKFSQVKPRLDKPNQKIIKINQVKLRIANSDRYQEIGQ